MDFCFTGVDFLASNKRHKLGYILVKRLVEWFKIRRFFRKKNRSRCFFLKNDSSSSSYLFRFVKEVISANNWEKAKIYVNDRNENGNDKRRRGGKFVLLTLVIIEVLGVAWWSVDCAFDEKGYKCRHFTPYAELRKKIWKIQTKTFLV